MLTYEFKLRYKLDVISVETGRISVINLSLKSPIDTSLPIISLSEILELIPSHSALEQ